MNKYTIKECLEFLNKENVDYSFKGNDLVSINLPVQINELKDGAFGFYRGELVDNYSHLFNEKNLVILKKEFYDHDLPIGNYIFTDNAQLIFTIIAKKFKEKIIPGIHKTAFVDPKAIIGENCYIGAFSYIGKDVILGNNVIIEESSVLKNKITVGNDVIIRSGVKLGNPGLGSIKNKKGRIHDFVHFGDIIIKNDVVIGDNTIINQGTLNTTIIGEGTRIAPNCCIAHGVNIGAFCYIFKGVIIEGSCKVGNNCWIASGAILRDGIKIGNNVTVGMGSVVTKDIPTGETWFGVPAKKRKYEYEK